MDPATTVAGAIPFTRTVGAKLDGQLPDQVTQRGLAGVVSLAAFFRNNRVRGTRKHHRARNSCSLNTRSVARASKIIASDVDQKCLRPLRFRQFAFCAGNRIDRRCIHHDVDPAEFQNRML